MAHDVRNPHIFQNGPGNIADGEATMDNFDVLWVEVDRAFSMYKTHVERASFANTAIVTSATTYVLFAALAGAVVQSAGSASNGIFYLDPADWLAGSRATKLRLRAAYYSNGTQTGVTTTVGLYPVSSISGGAVTTGTVVTGSTVAFANPAINTMSQNNSGDFNAPAAGHYVLGFNASGAFAASAGVSIAVQLQFRQV
jgi:hypothetical protein